MRAKLGLAVRLFQQQHALAGTHAGIEGAERVARGVEHPQRPAQFGDLLRELTAVHGAGHDDVGEQKIERRARIHHSSASAALEAVMTV